MKTINIRISPKAQIFLVLAVVLYFLIPRAIDVALNFATIGFGEVDPSTNSRYVIAIDPNNWANVAVAKRIPERIAGYRLYVNGEEILPGYYSDASGIPDLIWRDKGLLYFTSDYDTKLWYVNTQLSPIAAEEVPLISQWEEGGPKEIVYILDITMFKNTMYVVGYTDDALSEWGWVSNVYQFLDGWTRVTDSDYVTGIAGGPEFLAVEQYYCLESSFCGEVFLVTAEAIDRATDAKDSTYGKLDLRAQQYQDLFSAENPKWFGPILLVSRSEYHGFWGLPNLTIPEW